MSRQYRGTGFPGVPVDRNPGAAHRLPPDPRGETWRHAVSHVLWSFGWEVARRLPGRVVFGLADWLARVAYRRAGTAVDQLRSNLARVVEPARLEEAVREGLRSYARYWVESFRASDIPPEELDRLVTSSGFEHMDETLDEGRGAIVLLAHHGSWDIAAHWAEQHGYHLAVVAEVLRPRKLFARFARLREGAGLEVIPHARGERKLDRLEEVLAANHMVGLLAERDLTGRGPVVSFFGEPARIPRGPMELYRRTRVPVHPATVLQRPGGRWHVEMLPALDLDGDDIETMARHIARALEELILLDPVQWHALQPVWLADVPAHRRGQASAGAHTEPGAPS